MKLKIKNFSKIDNTEINVDGITVIAGENNTGKSTVGKILFSLFNSVSDIENKIEKQRASEIEEACRIALRNFISNNLEMNMLKQSLISISRQISSIVIESEDKVDEASIVSLIEKVLSRFSSPNDRKMEVFKEVIDEMTLKILAILDLPEEKIKLEVISRYFNNIFNSQINSLIDNNLEANLELTIKEKGMKLSFLNNTCTELTTEFNIVHNAFYIDNPFVIDNLSSIYPGSELSRELINYLISAFNEDIMDGLIGSVITKEKLDNIYGILQGVIDGNIVMKGYDEFYLEKEDFNQPVHFNNLSTGIKSFVILKMLLEKNILKEKDVLILDEPEIHLHPQWQIVYAELVVLLQKYFDLSIVVTTHSPYFLDAINIFSVKHSIDSKVNYYLTSTNNNKVTMECVSNNIDLIYKKMASPLQLLDSLRYELNNK